MKVLALIIMMNIGSGLTVNKAHAQDGDVSFQVFYDGMSPYGNWVNYPGAGYVWVPNVDAGFSPYGSNGHWVMTDYGWTWVSDYAWGWAPFHYGRWDYDNSYGWVWAPDNVWGPAWVSWRDNDGYYGWCPMRPGVSIEASFGGGYNGYEDRWTFVNRRDFDRDDVSSHYENRSNNRTIIQNTTVINNTYTDNSRHNSYATGPKREDVQKSTGRPVQNYKVSDSNKPGQSSANGGGLSMYRPQVQRTTANDSKPAPRNVVAANDVKPIGKREYVNQQQPAAKNNVSEKKPETVQQTTNKSKPEVQKTNTPVTPQTKRVEPVQQTTVKNNVVEQKKEVVTPVQQQKAAPVHQATRQENIDKARQVNRPAQQQNAKPPARPNPPKQNNTPKPAQQPVKGNTPQPEPRK